MDNVAPRRSAFAPLTAATLLACAACGSSAPASPLDPSPPESAALEDLLPAPAPDVSFRAAPGAVFSLLPAGFSPALAPASSAAYALGSVPAEDREEPTGAWRFGVDGEALRVALGAEAVEAGRVRLAEALRPLLERPELRASLAAAVASQPGMGTVDLTGAWTVAGLAIDTLSLADGHLVDSDGDGVHETTRSVLTLRLQLPAVPVAAPAVPFSACETLLGDGSAAAALAAEEGQAYIAPAAATWDRHLALVLHVTFEDLAPAHAALWSPTSYISRGERAAAAHDLALFRRFLAEPAAHLAGAELAVALVPGEALAHETLAVVSALATAASDAACLRQVDGWLSEPAILVPALGEGHIRGTEAPRLMVQGYDPDVDALDATIDPGLVCLHDGDGKPVMVGEELACATPSGRVWLVEGPSAGGGSSASAPVTSTPYSRMVETPKTAVAGTIASCDANPWKKTCTGRFGRGIRLCLGEWALRDQVGDYWNIHWYQSAWKAAAQTAIKAGGYLLRGVVLFYLGSGEVLPRLMVAAAAEGGAYIGDVVGHLTHSKVAGYSIRGYGAYVAFVWERTFMDWGLIKSSATLVESFVADRVVDGLAQMLEVTAVGWQDYSHGSHGCGFKSN